MAAILEKLGLGGLLRKPGALPNVEPSEAQLSWERARTVMAGHNGIDVIADVANLLLKHNPLDYSIVVEERVMNPAIENDLYGVSVRFKRAISTSGGFISKWVSIYSKADGEVEVNHSDSMGMTRFGSGVSRYEQFVTERSTQGIVEAPTVKEMVEYLIDNQRELIAYDVDHRMDAKAANGPYWQNIPGEWDFREHMDPASVRSEPVNNGIVQGFLSKIAKEYIRFDPTFGIDRFTLRNPNGTFQTVFLANRYAGISFAAQVTEKGVEVVAPYTSVYGRHDRTEFVTWGKKTILVNASKDSPFQKKYEVRQFVQQELKDYFDSNVKVDPQECPFLKGKEVVREKRV